MSWEPLQREARPASVRTPWVIGGCATAFVGALVAIAGLCAPRLLVLTPVVVIVERSPSSPAAEPEATPRRELTPTGPIAVTHECPVAAPRPDTAPTSRPSIAAPLGNFGVEGVASHDGTVAVWNRSAAVVILEDVGVAAELFDDAPIFDATVDCHRRLLLVSGNQVRVWPGTSRRDFTGLELPDGSHLATGPAIASGGGYLALLGRAAEAPTRWRLLVSGDDGDSWDAIELGVSHRELELDMLGDGVVVVTPGIGWPAEVARVIRFDPRTGGLAIETPSVDPLAFLAITGEGVMVGPPSLCDPAGLDADELAGCMRRDADWYRFVHLCHQPRGELDVLTTVHHGRFTYVVGPRCTVRLVDGGETEPGPRINEGRAAAVDSAGRLLIIERGGLLRWSPRHGLSTLIAPAF